MLQAAEVNASDDESDDAGDNVSNDVNDHDVSKLGRSQCCAVFDVVVIMC